MGRIVWFGLKIGAPAIRVLLVSMGILGATAYAGYRVGKKSSSKKTGTKEYKRQ